MFDIQGEDHNQSSKTNDLIKKKKTPNKLCKICESPALYSSFGTITCDACRLFFRRNAERGQKEFKCHFSGHCVINVNTRHICAACRLNKCFVYGMQIELIRPSRPKTNLIKQKNQSAITTSNISIRTLNLLHSDQSRLSIDQWNDISNLIHCYDDHGTVPVVQRFMLEQNSLPLKLRYKYEFVGGLYTSISAKIQQMYEKNGDYLSLCLEDQSALIRRTVKYATGFGGIVVLDRTKLLQDPFFLKTNEIIFGANPVSGTQSSADYLDHDLIFLKLIIAILSFSTVNCTTLSTSDLDNFIDIKTIIRIQDKYIELAWKYMIYKYSYQHAVLRFTRLLRSLFYTHRAIAEVEYIKQYVDMIDSVVQQTEQTLSIHDK